MSSLKNKCGLILGILLISGNLVSSQWQEHSINCYTCEGSACASQLGDVNECSVEQSCVTVFSKDDNTSVIARGCSEKIAATHASYCDSNTERCLRCSSNGCNTAKSLSEYVTCLSCDSSTDKNCLINPSSITTTKLCRESCMVALYAHNLTDPNTTYELSRSCLDDKNLDDREICSKGEDALCKTCKSTECNGDDPVENRLKCWKCDGNCDDAKNEYCVQYIKDDKCYFKFDEQKDVIGLGCSSDLKSEDLVAQIKNKSLVLCDGEECNFFDKIPQDEDCKECDSETDEYCATHPTRVDQSVKCAMPYSHCYSMVENRKTIRGCINGLSDDLFYECLTNGTKHCNSCIGKHCNEEVFDSSETGNDISSLIGEYVGDPGLWQGIPLNCYTCYAGQCDITNSVIKKCMDNELQTCVTVFSQAGRIIARGCRDEVTAKFGTYCETNPNDCFQCKSNGCNLAMSKTDYIECIFCDSKTNASCNFDVKNVNQTRKCHKACMTAMYPRTSEQNPSYNLIRTCLDDKDLDDRDACGTDDLCHSCSDPLCNTQLIPVLRKVCQHCSGDSCQIPTTHSCQSYTHHEQCLIKFDQMGGVSEMGCKSDYDPAEIRSLLVSNRLFLCDEDNCNKFENLPKPISCRLCNSRTDSFCATEPRNVATSTACNRLPTTSCYTRLLDDGHTERGCLSSLNDDQFMNCYNNNYTKCTICNEDICNDEMFPLDRLACHTCNSAEDATCDVNPKHSDICLKYSNDQSCVTALIDGITYRGCSSEMQCNSSDKTTCRTCNTSHCNTLNLKRLSDVNPGVWQSLPLNCYVCSGDECKKSLTRLNMCIGNDNQHCMTVFDNSGTVTRRGCSDDVEKEFGKYCDESSDKCFNCNSNGCNNASSLNDYISCIHCDSKLDKNCVQDLTTVTSIRRCNTACMVALRSRSVNETSIFELSRSCLDDKDLDDRESCGSDGSICKSCTSDNCNNKDVFEDRLECNSCLDENCENPMSKKCAAYVKNDTCFILFDKSSYIKQMGCTSQLDVQELEENLDKMLTCSGRNCNDFSIIPAPQLCVACDSSIDARCASTPKDVPSVSKCSSLPHFECYIKIMDDGTTTRGCISELNKTQRQACLVGSDEYCFACFGNKCNSKVFPEDRLRCHKCNSLDDPNCQDNPDSSTVCPVYSDDEVCTSKLVNGVTYRGCGSDFICDDSDKQYCKICNTTDCNVANLYKNNIGYPGNWQDLPINCYTCFGNECDNNSTTLLRKCENNNLQNCVTVFNMAKKVVQRGCSDTMYEGFYDHHCDRHPDLCTYCKSSGCNDAASMDEYVDCLFCDSTTNPNCTVANVSNTRKCKNKCMTSLYPRSDDSDPAYELSRSCLDDKELDDRTKCENGNEKFCQFCEKDGCNNESMPSGKRLSCLRCAAGDCENAVGTICPAYRDNDSCYILFDNSQSVAQMGCKSDFDSSTLKALRKKMIFCESDDCNKYDLVPKEHKCLQCNSQEDPLCATNPSSLTNFTQCTNMPLTSCYARIHDGHTVRGCMSDLEIETIDECIEGGDKANCKICDTDTCNSLMYPENRQLCYRCSSDNDENCQSNPTKPSACPIYQENDQCGVAIFGETTNRGCKSELSCNTDDRETCRICSSKNCNTIDLLSNYIGPPGQWQDLPLNCYTCEGDACKNPPGAISMCGNNNLQKCETVFDSTNAVVRRGCSDDVAQTHGEYCDTHSGYCQQCKSSGCNNITKLDDYVECVFCDSTTNPNCVLDPEGVLKKRQCNKQCMVALFPRSSEEDPSYELSRSCLDDKDLDDRQYCIDNKDKHCHACSGKSCNDLKFPDERHECWSCRGKECEDDAVVQKCVSYHPKDQCYTMFDNTSSLIGMGCRSEYEHSAVADLIQKKRLLLCDGKLCNAFENIPDAQSCIVCNSAIDPRCATNPNLIINSTICSQLPYTGCHTLINKDGHTERGCQSALDTTAFIGCHTQSDPACSICQGNKCNIAVYPADRLMCQRCNSQDDGETCAKSPTSNSVCPQITADDKCVTTYKNGVTYRGCSSELSCDTSDKKTCRICNESGCNTVNLEFVAKDGEPGKWQDLPIKCYTCVGDACKNDDLGPPELCLNNNLQNCVTVFNAQGQVIQRGCSDAVAIDQESYCEENTDKCFRCNSNECNKATTPKDYIQCLSCDTSTNSSCVKDLESLTNVRMCYKGCMTALYPRSTEDDPAYDTIRTCLDDKELADQKICESESQDLCKSCDTAMCNKQHKIPSDRHSCSHCSGDDCQLPRNETCSGYRKNDQCSLLLDGENTIIKAGCKSDFTNDQVVTLIKAKRLFLCEGVNCNTFEALPSSQTCFLCNSRTDPNCAIKPNDLFSTSRCNKLPYTQCYSRVLDDGATERGCLSDLEDNQFYDCLNNNSTKCSSCSGNNCNGDIYPDKRLSCHICDSGSDPNYCEANPNSISICPKYDENDVCVTSFTAGTTYRGCGSEIQCDSSDRKKCRICNTGDGCNTVNLAIKQDDNFGKWQDLPLECFECNGNNCNGQLGDARKCQNNNEQDCSTVFDNEGRVIRRGCSDDIDEELEDYCDRNPALCFNCKSNGCNTATTLNEFTDCIYCDSNKDKTCVTSPNSTLQSRKCHGRCMTALYPSDSSSSPSYDLIRTCLNDKEAADQTSCKEPLCAYCEGDSCNKHNLPEKRLSCHSCVNEECENPVSELCPLHKEGDQCFIRFDSSNNIAEMGCLSAFRGQDTVDILKTKRVYICETENCNTLDKIPQPQKCATCDSAEDVNCAINAQQIGTVNSCNALPYPNCYTKIAPGGTTHRGCLADLSADEFASCLLSGGDNCTHCIGDVCNKEIFPKTRLKCYSCTSDTDPDCHDWPLNSSVCPYVRDSEKCVTALSGNRTRTERGCSSQLLCDTTDKSTCRHCSSTGCNSLDLMHRQDDRNHGMWQELPLKCHNCIGADCAHSLGPAIPCQGGDEQDCMTVLNDQGSEVVRRGCTFDVEDEFDIYCRQNPNKCISCKSNECNAAWNSSEFTKCAYCNSETDASCVTRPNHGSFETRQCHKGCMAASFTAANGTTQVIRTCLDDKETQAQHQCSGESSSDCSSCTVEVCNLFNYPKDRLTCHVCMGTGCPSTVEENCAAYVKGDKCYAKYDNDKVEFSGCSSDIDSLVLQEWKAKNQLHECLENNCNAPGKLPTAQTCVACDSSKNVECATKPSAVNETQICRAPVSSCMMKITNTVTHRGCLNSLPYNDQNVCEENANGLTLCGKCSGDKCNSVVYPSNRRSCFVCKSDEDKKCVSEPDTISVCPNYSKDNQCVTKYEGSITERGCSTELTCNADDADHCQICNTNGCNDKQLDNGVGTIIANNLLVTLLVATVSLIALTSNKWF